MLEIYTGEEYDEIEDIDLELVDFTETILCGANKLENLTEEELEIIIQKSIIPRMDDRSDRTEHMSREEILKKLYNPKTSEKPGEHYELFYNWEEPGAGYRLFGIESDKGEKPQDIIQESLEIADVVYYTLQPNYTPLVDEEVSWNDYWGIFYGGSLLPNIFCIIKYRTRLQFGDRPNYKEIETYVMSKYLEELRNNRMGKYHWYFPGARV